MPVDVSQSGQSKLHTVGGHRPGGPTIAGAELDDSDVRPACTALQLQRAAGLGGPGGGGGAWTRMAVGHSYGRPRWQILGARDT